MHSHEILIRDYIRKGGLYANTNDLTHATIASAPENINGLRMSVQSLLPQVNILHVFLIDFTTIPDFLFNDKIYITRSQDFGNIGECGKYYWVGDLAGYHFICSDNLIYPPDYVAELKKKIHAYDKKIVFGTGGYLISKYFVSFDESTEHLQETKELKSDIMVPILKDSCLAYHSSTIRINRHYFYQPQLSSLWFSIAAFEQGVRMMCLAHSENWLKRFSPNKEPLSEAFDKNNYRSFLLKAFFYSGCTKNKKESLNLNSFFDRIYVMNLDRRPDRWEKVIKRTQKHNIKVARFSATDGHKEPIKSQWEAYFKTKTLQLPIGVKPIETYREKYLDYNHYISRINFMETKLGKKAMQSPGAYGYALSYINIIKEAIAKNFRRILIFDDDIILHKNFKDEFAKRMDMLPDNWKIIMLGAMQHHWGASWISWVNEFLYHCNGTSIATHAVGIDNKVFLPILYIAEKLDLPIDEGAIYHMQSVYRNQCFIFYPNLAIQDVSESEINSSAISKEDVLKKNNLFKWHFEDYDF